MQPRHYKVRFAHRDRNWSVTFVVEASSKQGAKSIAIHELKDDGAWVHVSTT